MRMRDVAQLLRHGDRFSRSDALPGFGAAYDYAFRIDQLLHNDSFADHFSVILYFRFYLERGRPLRDRRIVPDMYPERFDPRRRCDHQVHRAEDTQRLRPFGEAAFVRTAAADPWQVAD